MMAAIGVLTPRQRRRMALVLFACWLGTIVVGSTGAVAQPAESEALISMDFRETEITDLLRLLAKQNDLNIIVSESVTGPVTVQFSGVSVQEAMDAIVTVNGYAYTRRGRVIKVTTPEEAEREPLTTRVFTLNNANPADLVVALESVLSPTGTVQADTRSNALIVTDVPGSINTIEGMLRDLDGETFQVRIEANIIETILDDDERLGIDWTILAAATGSVRPTTFPFPRAEQSGPFYPLVVDSVLEGSGNPPSDSTRPDFPVATEADFTFGTLNFSAFSALIEMLADRSDTKTLANPTIITLNNQLARINVGSIERIPEFEVDSDTGTLTISGFEEEEVGITLAVTPHVNSAQEITLELAPEVSAILSFQDFGGFPIPRISSRSATTQVRIHDGETVVIGGLINETTVNTRETIPYLSKVPLLGRLFSHRNDRADRTDLYIFVTAHIIQNEIHAEFTDEAKRATKREDIFPEIIPEPDVEEVILPKPLHLPLRPRKTLTL